MIRIRSFRRVMTPDQCCSTILAMTKNRGSSLARAGISILSGSSHNSCASKKRFGVGRSDLTSMPTSPIRGKLGWPVFFDL